MLASLSRARVSSVAYSELTNSIYKQRVICSLPYLNTDANDHARLTAHGPARGPGQSRMRHRDPARGSAPGARRLCLTLP
eukprot:1774372-Prymnesium_polylepis.1